MLGSEHEDSKPFAEEGYALMAAVFEVHRELGGGLSEEIYQQSLEIELESREIPFCSKTELGVFYKSARREVRSRFNRTQPDNCGAKVIARLGSRA